MGGLLQPCWLPGRERLKPALAIGEVDRQVLSSPILPGGVEEDGAEKLIAGRDVRNQIRNGPIGAPRRTCPAMGRNRINRLQVPLSRLGEAAGLCVHSTYLNSLPRS